MLVESVGVRSGALNFVLLADHDATIVLLTASRRRKWLERQTAGAAEANLVPGATRITIHADHGDASAMLPFVEATKIVLVMRAHATDVTATVLQNIHGCRRRDLVRPSLLHLILMTVAVRAIRHRLILNAQIHNLREEAVLRAHGELLVIAKAILILEVQLVRSLRVSGSEAIAT